MELSWIILGIPNGALYNTQSKANWLFKTQSRVLQADWLILKNNEEATLNINIPYILTSNALFSVENHIL